MSIALLLVLASVGGIVLGVWDLTRHGAQDLLGSLAFFVSGMLVGGTAFLLLPAPAGAYLFGSLAVGSSALAWKGLDGAALHRSLSSPLPSQLRKDGLEGVLALRGRADVLESNRENLLGPALAFVFALILAGKGVQGQSPALVAAAVVMAVPFGRLARHHVESLELRQVEHLLQPAEADDLD